MSSSDERTKEMDAMEGLYTALGIETESYIETTLFSVVADSMAKGERFSIADIVTEDDIKTLLSAALVLKKVSFVNETFYSPKNDHSDDRRAKSADIANELHLAADNIQQFALITAVAKGISDYEVEGVNIVSMIKDDEVGDIVDGAKVVFMKFDA